MSDPRPQTTLTFALLNAVFMAVGAGIAAWSLHPVFGSARFVSTSALAIGAGAAIALLCDRLRWSGLVASGLALAVFVVGGLLLVIPGVTSGDVPLDAAFGELARGPVAGWKDIVTLPLPLGEYRGTLVPTFSMLLIGTLASCWLALTARRWWWFAAVLTVAMVVTAIVVGPATRALPLAWARDALYVNREFLVGLAAFALLLLWFGWRSAYARRRALARAADGAHLSGARRARSLAALTMGTVMVVAAVTSAALIAGPVSADTPRDVARTVIEPPLMLDSTVTPLAAYRAFFSDAAFDEPLFTVKVTRGEVSRVRIATLPYFDGDSFTASAPDGTGAARFQRVPSAIPAPADSRPVSAEVHVQAMTGIWVPLVGALGSVTFHGDRAGKLLDGFYYQPDTRSALETAPGGLATGDIYSEEAYTRTSVPPLEAIGRAPEGDVIDSNLIPVSLTDWVTRQAVTRDGAGLAELVTRLRERGYLSHGISSGPSTPRWESSLGAYAFASSAAGHSYDRIDRLFTALLGREAEVGTSGESLIAAVGDDEQFATAVALMAADLGFPSRVVLGAHLADADDTGWSVPACVDGVCRGQNMAVWAEVQSANGTWVPIDVTPQHRTPPSPDVTQQQDPKFVSALDPQRAEPIVPPSSQRGSTSDTPPSAAEEPGAWAWLGPVVKVAGISLLAIMVFVGPLIAIVVWKALRRRRRRGAAPRDAIHHGWDEYVDTAVDAGLAPLPLATRVETAHAYGSPNGERLAQLTDRATFDTSVAVASDAAEFWELVTAERERWLADKGFWARMRMRLSMRSVWHSVATQAPDAVPGEVRASGQHPEGEV